MSRNQPSVARYKISNPQPLASADSQNGGTAQASQLRQAGYPPPPRPEQAASRYSAEANKHATPTVSPMRPARSRLRDAPSVPIGPSTRQEQLALHTHKGRRPSQSSSHGEDLPASPISFASPSEPIGMFSDPFAEQRNERAELRAQVSTAAQQASLPQSDGGTNNDKLRNVVGAFMAAGRRDEPAVRRPGKNDARQQRTKQTAREEIWEVGPEGGGKFAEIDGVVRKIRKDWPFVMDSDFSPSTLALSLLSQTPSSSLPAHPPLSAFIRLHDALSSSLQSAVQAHFQSFAASLPAHATFIATLSRAQGQVRQSKKALRDARDGFAGKGKLELSGVRIRERQVRDMLRILDMIDNLKQVPDQLESLIGDKQFLKAALVLVKSLKTIAREEIAEIGAMSELKQYLAAQETTLFEILVEELHNHLYLKTIYSDSRWKPHTPGQQSLPVIESINNDNRSSIDGPTGTSSAPNGEPSFALLDPSSQFSRYLSALSIKPNREPMLDSLDIDNMAKTTLSQATSTASLFALPGTAAEPANFESDPYSYMETLMDALNTLGRLGPALEIVTQRVSTEVHALIDLTLDEVEERLEQRREEAKAGSSSLSTGQSSVFNDRFTSGASLFAPSETMQLAVSLDVLGPPHHAMILRDLFWTLYSKLAAVLEGHRAVYEIARWISSRRDFKDVSSKVALNVPVGEIWKPIQQEVRMLLNSYLTDDSQDALDRHAIMSINEILRQGKIARDRQRVMFKFADTDSRAIASEIKAADDTLQHALRSSVPGLVGIQVLGESGQSVLNGRLANADDTAAKHRTLIPPNAFNVTTLFQPTLAFIERAVAIVPPGFEDETEAFGSVLEDFVVKVFLPQLDERVTASFQQAVSGYDAYQVDRQLTETVVKPPLKSSVRVMALIHSLCLMLETTPFHRENYSRLIIGVIVQYYQQCSTRFKELASLPITDATTAELLLALPGVWAQREDIIQISTELRAVTPADHSEIALISQKETKLEMELLADKPIVESQLINSSRKLEALGHLSQSLRWFIDSLLDLQSISDVPALSETSQASTSSPARHFMAPAVEDLLAAHGMEEPRLPLTRAMAQRFEAIIQTYEQLAEMVLNTIRLEMRCRVICNLGASLLKGDFRLESEALEPDPDVVDLDVTLIDLDAVATRSLSEEDRVFVLRGLGHLVDHLFITSARSIKMVNPAGVRKIKRHILSLQQTLRGLTHGQDDGVLSRSMGFWDIYERGPKNMLETIRTTKPAYSFEDYNTMLNLQCKVDQSEAPSSELNTYLIDLHALSMSIEGWEMD